jgi:hypothetical protein
MIQFQMLHGMCLMDQLKFNVKRLFDPKLELVYQVKIKVLFVYTNVVKC